MSLNSGDTEEMLQLCEALLPGEGRQPTANGGVQDTQIAVLLVKIVRHLVGAAIVPNILTCSRMHPKHGDQRVLVLLC
jgi:hypothetical protein